jgi:hypothetical protein
LSNGGGDFQSGEENSFLSLECDVFRPLDESGQVSAWLDVVTKSEVSWSLLKKRIGFLLDFLNSSLSFGSFTHFSFMIIEYYKLVDYLLKNINLFLTPYLPNLQNTFLIIFIFYLQQPLIKNKLNNPNSCILFEKNQWFKFVFKINKKLKIGSNNFCFEVNKK